MAGYNNYGYPYPSVDTTQTNGVNYVPRYSGMPTMVYVNGIEGANAYQMPNGVTEQILWDADKDIFYVKKLDQMGRPRVVAVKDYFDHVEPEKTEPTTQPDIDLSKYVTKDDLNKIIQELTVGLGGRIVRNNELTT